MDALERARWLTAWRYGWFDVIAEMAEQLEARAWFLEAFPYDTRPQRTDTAAGRPGQTTPAAGAAAA